MKDKKEVLRKFRESYDITRAGLRKQYQHIDECEAFYAGDYMNYRDDYAFGRGASRRIKEVSFNCVQPYVNSIVGFAAQNRRKPDYRAREQDSQEQRMRSDYINGASDFVRERTNADNEETRQDRDLIVGGVGVTDTTITLEDGSATRDPNGEIIVERVKATEVGWDPLSEKPGLLDSRWVYRVKEYDVEEAENLFNADEDDFEFISIDDEDINDYHFNPYGGIQDKIGYEYADSKRKLARVYFYQWFDIEPFYRLENPLIKKYDPTLEVALSSIQSGENEEMFSFDPKAMMLVVTKENKKEVKEIFDLFEIPFNPIISKRKVYYTAIISGNRVFDVFRSVSQQGFSLKFKTGNRDEKNHIWTGIVASMRDPQRYYNKSLTEMMLIIANNSRGGVLYESDAIPNIREFEAKWAMSNAAVEVNDGALSGGKIQPKATAHMPSGYENILSISSESVGKVTGVDESFFGAVAGGNETAMLQRQRIKRATVVLSCYMDSISLYGKEQAELMLSFIRLLADSSEGAVFTMSAETGEPVQEVLAPDFFSDAYDIVIGEEPEDPVQKEFMFNHLSQAALAMLSTGNPGWSQIYLQAVEQLPITNRAKSKIREALQDNRVDPAIVERLQQQVQELTGQAAQVQIAGKIADIKKTQAEAAKVSADAQQSIAAAQEKVALATQRNMENNIIAANGAAQITHSI